MAGLISPAHAADEHTRISQERRQAETLYRAREQACQEQFAVTACVEEAKAQRRKTLESLAQQQAVLDDAQRKQRAAQRMQQIHERVTRNEADAKREAPPVRVRTPRKGSAAELPASTAPMPPDVAPPPGAGASSAAARHATPSPQGNRAEFERRQREAAAHKDDVERKALDRASRQNKPPSSLPATPEIPASAAR